MKRYRVKEVFATLQGEGAQTGTSAVFLRFTGCNAWSGLQEHRARDIVRTGASCAQWCDTDFVDGDSMTLMEVVDTVIDAAGVFAGRPDLVVCTGGEPLLQLDAAMTGALHAEGFKVAVETNGSLAPPQGVDWLCVSPKWLDSRWKQTRGDELKLVVPAFEPNEVWKHSPAFGHYFVQPQDGVHGAFAHAISVVERDPRWRLSVQVHKLLGLR